MKCSCLYLIGVFIKELHVLERGIYYREWFVLKKYSE